jgi:predicted outer membrane protein
LALGVADGRSLPFRNVPASTAIGKRRKEEMLRFIRKSTPAWASGALAFLALPATAAAQTGTAIESPPAASAALPPAEQIARFIASAIPTANYIASASRMATAYAQNSKLHEIALELAKDQTSVANSLTAWVNVSGPVVTRRSPSAGGSAGATKVTAPRLLPAQVSNLRQLSQLRGQGFDALYVSSLKESLSQLQMLYRDLGEAGGDAGLRAIANRELPKLEKAISALNGL